MPDLDARRFSVAARLREARRLAGLSQAQVAKLMGLHRPTVTEIEAGRRRVASEELAALSDLYGVTTAWLLGEEDENLSLSAVVAARELERMTKEDLDRLIGVITAIRESKDIGG